MQRIIHKSFYHFSLSKFKPQIHEAVLADTAPNLHPPQVISTEDR